MTDELKELLASNRVWAERHRTTEPDFFSKLTAIQRPEYLWIGCSDSRVPANQIVGLKPGEGEFTGPVTSPWGDRRVGFALTGEIDREDFGLTWNAALETGGVLISDTIKLSFDVEATKA